MGLPPQLPHTLRSPSTVLHVITLFTLCVSLPPYRGCLGCFLIPFFTKCCKDVDHYCPCCQYHIYRYKRL
uniref:LITAF domain-containing protein n=1 Tax=Varanus komodoensis TaxID=61221 RepID=A0A8D2LNM1_VARKO